MSDGLDELSFKLAISVIHEIFEKLSKIDKQMFILFLPDTLSEDKTISDTALSTIMRILGPYSRKDK